MSSKDVAKLVLQAESILNYAFSLAKLPPEQRKALSEKIFDEYVSRTVGRIHDLTTEGDQRDAVIEIANVEELKSFLKNGLDELGEEKVSDILADELVRILDKVSSAIEEENDPELKAKFRSYVIKQLGNL